MNHQEFLDKLIDQALTEDVGSGDVTADATIDALAMARAEVRAKEDMILAGLDVAEAVFQKIDKQISCEIRAMDGDHLRKGNVIAVVSGPTRSLLKAERTALNFLQRLSGVATHANRFVKAIEGTSATILDTRKTIPGYRTLEKYAVKTGGAQNHRVGLFDQYLIKDNHITAAGSVVAAVERVMKVKKPNVKVEVEVKNLEEFASIVDSGVDIVMLDNFSIENIKQAVALNKGRVKLEVSGNVSLSNVRAYAETGVDYISVGAITHSAPAADIHMKFV